MSRTEAAPQATEERTGFSARHVLVLVALLWAVALNPIVSLLSGNAQAQVAIHFHTTQIVWFTQGALLVATFVLPFAVKAAGLYGKKRVLVIVAVFGLVGDLIAALSSNYTMLLVGRAVAGIYGAAAAVAYATARDVFPRRLVGPASALLGGSIGIVALGGPFLSGWLLDTWGFHGALWFMAISTALCVVILAAFVPESPVREEHGRMDWLGGLLLGAGLTAIVYAVGQGQGWGWTSGKFFAYVGGGLLALVAFVLVERRIAHPLFPTSLLKRRQVWAVLLATAVTSAATYAVGTDTQLLALMPRIPTISDGLGWTATHNAWVTSPLSILIIASAVATGVLARRVDTRILLIVGSLLAAVGYGLGSQLHHTAAQLIIMGLVGGPGTGLVLAVAPIMIIEAVSPKEQALANGAQAMLVGIAQVVFTQLTFVLMAQGGKVMQGTQFYKDSGFTNGFWFATAACAAGALLALLIPKPEQLDQAEVGQAASLTV
ncbi:MULTISPECIES: MFS transporter [Streptacidiphilus]|uniref:MFS transporter n=1 Tax=Streptacidiphilus cavernicola TaxID=3342716 RepID=A0ABV6UMV3_9ACTN|nr:MFS transporter [Streptacidiphilus jeojiense]